MNNGHKDRLDRIEKLLAKTAELGQMTALQAAENAKQITRTNQQISRMAKEHAREMKEIRALFKQMIRRIAV